MIEGGGAEWCWQVVNEKVSFGVYQIKNLESGSVVVDGCCRCGVVVVVLLSCSCSAAVLLL